MFSGHGLEIGRGRIAPGQELTEAAVWVSGDDALDHVGQVAVRLDAGELAGLDQGCDHGPVLGAAVVAGEEGVIAGERDRADGALDHVGVDLDATVVEEQAEPGPAGERVADRLGELALLADEGELLAQPGFEEFDERP